MRGLSGLLNLLLRRSLAQQLTLLALLPAALATLIATAVLTREYLASVTDLMRANAETVSLQVSNQAMGPLAKTDRRALMEAAQLGSMQPHVRLVQIWSEDGEILAQARGTAAEVEGVPALRSVLSVVGNDGIPLGKVMVEVNLQAVAAARQSIGVTVALVLAACLLAVSLAGRWAARHITAPICALGEAVDRLGAGEEASVSVKGAAEVRRLQRGFNQAASALLSSQHTLQTRIEEATAELERKNAQLEIASQAKTRLLAAASHDLRQPLHALTLFSDGLAQGETDPVRLQRVIHIQECVESLDLLFSELLNLSQLDAGVLQPQWLEFPLDGLLDQVSRNFRAVAESQDLRFVVRKTDAWVRCDPVMLSRILNNLVTNALRHTTEGGILLAARQRGGRLHVEVFDTGVGIAPQHQARVFEEFFQVDNQHRDRCSRGMGLGLATVQRLALLLNAKLTLRSVLGRGTCVSIALQEAMPPQRVTLGCGLWAGVPPTQPGEATNLHGVRILVIDDEPSILEGLQLVLSGWGAVVWVASSRAQALALADGWASPPDVVVTDLLLQGGDSGLGVLSALALHPNGIGRNTARILVTGETHADRLREVAQTGIAVLYKPVAPRVLRSTIASQLKALGRDGLAPDPTNNAAQVGCPP